MKRTILLALVLACGAAQASNWVRISAKDAPAQEYVDLSSVQVDGSRRIAWLKFVFRPHSYKGNSTKFYANDIELADIQCDTKQTRELSITVQYEDGSSEHSATAREWEPIPPDTAIEVAMLYLCKPMPNPSKAAAQK